MTLTSPSPPSLNLSTNVKIFIKHLLHSWFMVNDFSNICIEFTLVGKADRLVNTYVPTDKYADRGMQVLLVTLEH